MQVVGVRGLEIYSEFAPASFMYLPPVLNVVIKVTVLKTLLQSNVCCRYSVVDDALDGIVEEENSSVRLLYKVGSAGSALMRVMRSSSVVALLTDSRRRRTSTAARALLLVL